MSIFRETFPDFVRKELNRRQTGMENRDPAFLHQLNSRTAGVIMESGVNYEGSNLLAKQNLLWGGNPIYTPPVIKDDKVIQEESYKGRRGIGSGGGFAYNDTTAGGTKNRLGIRPMPGITNVEIKSKSAYGSLQEATVSFVCWDIKQLEELEILYMRPGYTVVLSIFWNYTSTLGISILDSKNANISVLMGNIWEEMEASNGNYLGIAGYVKNYNWSSRDDGGYDCTTTIISFGEVLESLKCNWVPGDTKAFDVGTEGLLRLLIGPLPPDVIESYEKGIIPGLLHELYNLAVYDTDQNTYRGASDPRDGSNQYFLYNLPLDTTNDRGGYDKFLGKGSKAEVYIALGSFCDLINKYVVPQVADNESVDRPLAMITPYETNQSANPIVQDKNNNTYDTPASYWEEGTIQYYFAKSLKCIASPLALSTNLGVCFVRNDNWGTLGVNSNSTSTSPTPSPTPPPVSPPVFPGSNAPLILDPNAVINPFGLPSSTSVYTSNVAEALERKSLFIIGNDILTPNFKEAGKLSALDAFKLATVLNPIPSTLLAIYDAATQDRAYYRYEGDLNQDFQKIANTMLAEVKEIKMYTDGIPRIIFNNGELLKLTTTSTPGEYTINLLTYFVGEKSEKEQYNEAYNEIFSDTDFFTESENAFHPVVDHTKAQFRRSDVLGIIKKYFINIPLDTRIQQLLAAQTPAIAAGIAQTATAVSAQDALRFLEKNPKNTKQLGNIANIYVNLNYLYAQAISKNVASNDPQNKNTISLRDYFQTILREIQNSLGNINNFDIHVDERNPIGRIVDLNFTGDPTQPLFTLQLHNTTSVVRDYKLSSKIFPEMGSIIAISAQDASGVGKLGYDNATLVAWNEGITDRLIPKKDINSIIKTSNPDSLDSYILPFLTKIYSYFLTISGQANPNINYVFGGLNFAYRDFLAKLDKFDERNKFKTIIPTELTITLDGISGIIIGNLFKINQDVVPKGYRNVPGRSLAYIVTGLGHKISNNDWTTEIRAYPVIFEQSTGTNVASKWKNNRYAGSVLTAGNYQVPLSNATPPPPPSSATAEQIAAMKIAVESIFVTPAGGRNDRCGQYSYAIGKYYIKALREGATTNYNVVMQGKNQERSGGDAETPGMRTGLKSIGYTEYYQGTWTHANLITELKTRQWEIGDVVIYFSKANPGDWRHAQIYTGNASSFTTFPWASSWPNNYGKSHVFESKGVTEWEYYIFKPPKS